MQRVTLGVGDSFGTVDTALKETFAPALSEGLCEGVPEQGVTRLPNKQEVLALSDPSQTTTSYTDVTREDVQTPLGKNRLITP